MSTLSVNPNVSVDCVVFGFNNQTLNVLLIEQSNMGKGFETQLALPGDLVLENEGLDDAANRVLKELTQLEGLFLKQFRTFGNPNRVKNVKDIEWLKSFRENPQARVITVGYLALIKMEDFQPEASSFAQRVFWSEIHEVPELAFDHNLIFRTALETLRSQFEIHHIGLEVMPELFTLNQLQTLYEAILDKKIDKRNFRKKIEREKIVLPTEEKQTGVTHKPARYYALNKDVLETSKN
ncbi:MAG: NUDIX domain-containing protein [Schleiferiaceae bacterium]